jgi:hypothetical protein
MDFKALKNKRKDALKTLQTSLTEKKTFQNDDREWQPTADKAGNGHAVIRFLDPKDGDVPYVRMFKHAFQSPKTGQWYIENSRSTIGESDPMMEYNSKLWNSGQEDQARLQKRKLSFISNILVIKDRDHPENEGKVKIFKYGKKIFEKISNMMVPPFDEEGRAIGHPDYDPVNAYNPFSLWDGANFTIRIRQVDGYRNYDESSFGTPGPVAKTDDEMKAIWEQTHNIDDLVSEDKFKSYADLQARMNRVLGLSDIVTTEPTAAYKETKQAFATPDREDDGVDDDLKKMLAEISEGE